MPFGIRRTCMARGGAARVESHAKANGGQQVALESPGAHEIMEYHFHVYFHPNCSASLEAAMSLRSQLLEAVAQRRFVAVLRGSTEEILPGLSPIPASEVLMKPVGPHTVPQYQVWVPKEFFSAVLSFIMLRRKELSVFLHPLGSNELEDHTLNCMWLGEPLKLNLDALEAEAADHGENAALGLGYSKGCYPVLPGQWWHDAVEAASDCEVESESYFVRTDRRTRLLSA